MVLQEVCVLHISYIIYINVRYYSVELKLKRYFSEDTVMKKLKFCHGKKKNILLDENLK